MYSCGRNIVLAKLGLQYVCSNLGWKEFCRTYVFLQIATKPRADEQTRTADLISLRVIIHALQELANPAYLSRFLFSGLPRIAPYCATGGIRVVSAAHPLSWDHRCRANVYPSNNYESVATEGERGAMAGTVNLG